MNAQNHSKSVYEIASEIEKTKNNLPSTNKSIKLQLEDGTVFVDLSGHKSITVNSDRQADCTVITTADTLLKLRERKMRPVVAMMTGKLKIKGEAALAMNLGHL